MGADVQRGRNKLPSHFLEGDALDPANRWPFIGSKVGGVHIPVLRQVDYAHVTKINRFHGFSSLSFVLHRVKDDLINQLLDGGTIISKIDVAGMLLAHMPIDKASLCYALEQRIR